MHIADSQYTIKLHSGRKISLEENILNQIQSLNWDKYAIQGDY